jgi:hypothetical protein
VAALFAELAEKSRCKGIDGWFFAASSCSSWQAALFTIGVVALFRELLYKPAYEQFQPKLSSVYANN